MKEYRQKNKDKLKEKDIITYAILIIKNTIKITIKKKHIQLH